MGKIRRYAGLPDWAIAKIAEEMKMGNELMQKAAFTSSDFAAGALAKEVATQFINLVVDETVLLKEVQVHMTDASSGTIQKLNVTGPISFKSTEATETTDTRKPTSTEVEFTVKKLTSAWDLSGEANEDSIEGNSAKGTILGAMTTAMGNDIEQLSIEGDDTISGSTASDKLLKTNDGWYTICADSSDVHALNSGGKAPSFRLLRDMIKLMPKKYRKDVTKLRWIMSPNTAISLLDELGDRATIGGDAARVTGVLPPIMGIAPLVVPLMPEDQTVTGSAGDAGTFIWLVNPKNFIFVVKRQITIEWERKPRKDTDEGTAHTRHDFVIENEDAVVMATQVDLDSTSRYGA